MCLIRDTDVRNGIDRSLQAIRLSVDTLSGQGFNLPAVDACASELMAKHAPRTAKRARSILEPELSIAYFGTLTLGMTSVVAEHDTPVLPANWIAADGRPDPNFVFAKMLTSLANSALGIVHLIERGIEEPARVVLRSFLELSWITCLALARRDIMIAYCKANNDAEE
jgi:hypothetical protein